MDISRVRIWLGACVLLVAAACGPTLKSQGGLNLNEVNSAGPAGFPLPTQGPQKPLACNPASISIQQVVPACINPVTGKGGISFVVQSSDPNAVTFDQSIGNVTCTGVGLAVSCTGSTGTQFEQEVCTFCVAPNAGLPTDSTLYGGFTCANGYVNHNGTCDPADPNQPTYACPPGTHFQNVVQNCVDDKTHLVVSPCPPNYPYYLPDLWLCTAKPYPEAYNCQYFPLQIGSCPNLAQLPINIAMFCQNKGANIGAVNLAYPAGQTLEIDTRGSRLGGCTPPGTNPVTCWGPSDLSFNAKLCKDPSNPATCTTYQETLGTCAPKTEGNGAAPPVPPVRPRGIVP